MSKNYENFIQCEHILTRSRIERLPKTYALGIYGQRVTFLSQQHRAFNLIWALFASGLLKRGEQVAIVGGGLGGMTSAVAAYAMGCYVTLYEQSERLMNLQRGCYHRYIHPTIHTWPAKEAEEKNTKLPYLNWNAGPAYQVVEEIEKEFDRIASGNINVLLRTEVKNVESVDDCPQIITSHTDTPEAFDCIILAVGYGLESQIDNVLFRSYWEDYGLHQDVVYGRQAKNRWLVIGCGDGGLIDTLRLLLHDFDHTEFVPDLFSGDDLVTLKEDLERIESNAHTLPFTEDIATYLEKEYNAITIPSSIEKEMRVRLRANRQVVLIGADVNPLSLRSQIINRFSVFLLQKYKKIVYQQGWVTRVDSQPRKYTVHFKTDKHTFAYDNFDDVVARTGPTRDTIKNLLSKEDLDTLRKSNPPDQEDRTSEKLWPPKFYPREKSLSSRKPITPTRKVSVQVGIYPNSLVGDKSRHIKTTEPQLDRSPQLEPLTCGSAIANHDDNMRRESTMKGGYSEGTLGCFVELATGEIGILSSSFALASGNGGIIGKDRIVQVNTGSESKPTSVATLDSYISVVGSPPGSSPAKGDVVFNDVEAAIAKLKPGIKYIPSFNPKYELPPITTTGEARLGDSVFKVGRTSGLTYGQVTTVSVFLPVVYESGICWFSRVFEIEGLDGAPFSVTGDAGSVVVRGDGEVLGIIFAGNNKQSYACSINAALDRLKCKLLTNKVLNPNGL